MTTDTRFYTYAWLREDGTPYYIGKGCGGRAYVKHRNWTPPPRERILILKSGLTNSEAIRHEVYLIAVLGRTFEGGLLRNLTAGGEGGRDISPESRRKRSEALKGRKLSDDHKKRVSEGMKALPKPTWFHKDGAERFFREQPPSGWEPGRPSTALHQDWDRGVRKWWCNEIEERWCETSPGKDWRPGRKKGQKRIHSSSKTLK